RQVDGALGPAGPLALGLLRSQRARRVEGWRGPSLEGSLGGWASRRLVASTDDPRRVRMPFRCTSRQPDAVGGHHEPLNRTPLIRRGIFARLGLVAAIAAFGMSSAVHAVPASAAPPDSGLNSQDLGTPGTPDPSGYDGPHSICSGSACGGGP